MLDNLKLLEEVDNKGVYNVDGELPDDDIESDSDMVVCHVKTCFENLKKFFSDKKQVDLYK